MPHHAQGLDAQALDVRRSRIWERASNLTSGPNVTLMKEGSIKVL